MIKSRFFTIGFLITLLLFTVINVYTYDDGIAGATEQNGITATECFDCLKQFGWPFRLYQSGTILHIDELLWVGLVADILIALLLSAGIGLLCGALLKKQTADLTSRKRRA